VGICDSCSRSNDFGLAIWHDATTLRNKTTDSTVATFLQDCRWSLRTLSLNLILRQMSCHSKTHWAQVRVAGHTVLWCMITLAALKAPHSRPGSINRSSISPQVAGHRANTSSGNERTLNSSRWTDGTPMANRASVIGCVAERKIVNGLTRCARTSVFSNSLKLTVTSCRTEVVTSSHISDVNGRADPRVITVPCNRRRVQASTTSFVTCNNRAE